MPTVHHKDPILEIHQNEKQRIVTFDPEIKKIFDGILTDRKEIFEYGDGEGIKAFEAEKRKIENKGKGVGSLVPRKLTKDEISSFANLYRRGRK